MPDGGPFCQPEVFCVVHEPTGVLTLKLAITTLNLFMQTTLDLPLKHLGARCLVEVGDNQYVSCVHPVI